MTFVVSALATVEVTPSVLASTSFAELQELVANITHKCPALESRAVMTCYVLMADRCQPVGSDRFEVAGTEEDPYSVDLLGETCSCKDFQFRAPEFAGSRFCKHLLSALLLQRLARRTVKREVVRRTRLVAYRPNRRPVARRVHSTLRVA